MYQRSLYILISVIVMLLYFSMQSSEKISVEKFISLSSQNSYSPLVTLYTTHQQTCQHLSVTSNGMLTPESEVDLLLKRQLGTLNQQEDNFYGKYIHLMFKSYSGEEIKKQRENIRRRIRVLLSHNRHQIIQQTVGIRSRESTSPELQLNGDNYDFINMINNISDAFIRESEKSKFDRSLDEIWRKNFLR